MFPNIPQVLRDHAEKTSTQFKTCQRIAGFGAGQKLSRSTCTQCRKFAP